MAEVCVIGAGLAGCEAAVKLAERGVAVNLYEMKPGRYSPAHSNPGFAELVCSNSLKAMSIENASGLLKEEMRVLGSVCVEAALMSKVPAGQALAVDRDTFSKLITEKIESIENIKVIREEVKSISELPPCDAVIIATGPLTSESLAGDIGGITGKEGLKFFDAAAPIVYAESVDTEKTFKAARYGKGTADYINCPMTKDEYYAFYDALVSAETAEVEEFDSIHLYEGCMPVEEMAKRGRDTLKFGPLKPVGLQNPDGTRPYAVVQLRQDDKDGTLFNIVGFQTRLKFPEQRRVFGMIPGLENAEYARYGVMHRNTYIKSPGILNAAYRLTESKKPAIYFAGQITGVEGYMESASSGIVAGINCAREVLGEEPAIFPVSTVIGALANYAANYGGKDFQPMGANFGIVDSSAAANVKTRDKAAKKRLVAENSLRTLEQFISEKNI
ncbi:MAG: methylenetetrahydrofolate--tRNA-(uracil(54)-C(5))-methyltransferase (FADH(2)-oxidizing) TrmFO [Clostridia bacterium]|nr:methylenetetrahydrofolate--tRNA-(uracil(54)-C(5))-methyltransferase (FADH(2)-oxidizing) TrmFO [Clostridia bacterium]